MNIKLVYCIFAKVTGLNSLLKITYVNGCGKLLISQIRMVTIGELTGISNYYTGSTTKLFDFTCSEVG